MVIKETWMKDTICAEKYKNVDEVNKIMELPVSSEDKIWWQCDKGHVWKCSVINHSKHKCPYCSGQRAIAGETDLATVCSELIDEWDFGKNMTVTPQELLPASRKMVWWKCKKGHSWPTRVYIRTVQGSGCPFCLGRKAIPGETDILSLYENLKEEWDFDKNKGVDPRLIRPGSHKEVWWKCRKGHSFPMVVSKRTMRKDGCPFCSGRYAIPGETDLGSNRPDIAEEWDYEKNKKKPSDYTVYSSKSVYWRCKKKNHSYVHPIVDRTSKNAGCPYCSGKKPIPGETDFESFFPLIALEWNYEKNRRKPSEYMKQSNARVWWICRNGHVWKASIKNRTKGDGCPDCEKENR